MAAQPTQPAKKRSSRGSKRSKKTSSSTALKLQLRTEEAALAINERFDREHSERSLRAINRESARAADDARVAEIDAQRQREKVERDTERRREELEDENLERAEVNKAEEGNNPG